MRIAVSLLDLKLGGDTIVRRRYLVTIGRSNFWTFFSGKYYKRKQASST